MEDVLRGSFIEGISIRAPLAGSDFVQVGKKNVTVNFNPRSPCGERRRSGGMHYTSIEFQSALPLRGATSAPAVTSATSLFQSALPLRGATAIFCSITLLSAKYCSFKDRRRKFIRQIPQNSSRTRYNVVRTSLVEHDRLWFATS